MFRTSNPVAARVYVFVNAAVALLVLLGVFTGVNWNHMPDGFGAFLAIRITVKNLIILALFLLGWPWRFAHSACPSRRPPRPFGKNCCK
jgi:protein-S-isoprenylcysteine O-methyltransferase Ste14